MQQTSYWERELYEQQYDLIVVGGGLSGQSTAHFYRLQYPDAKILVMDRAFFPLGASTRNAGFACIGTIGEHIADLKIDSEDFLKERIMRRYNGLLLLREILGDEAIQYEDCGGWDLFTERDKFEESADQVAFFNGWMKELLGEEDAYKIGSYQGYPTIFNRLEGMLHPGKMIRHLYEMNVKDGIEFRWNSEIQHVDTENALVTTVAGQQLKAGKIVLATNAFTNKILPHRIIKPGRGYIFVTKPIPDLAWKGTFHHNEGYVYFRNLGSDRLLLGGGRNVDTLAEETSIFGINGLIKSYLVNFANEIIKLPIGWEIEQEWSGIMGFTETKSPYMEKVSDQVILVAGLSGMGVAMGMQLGKDAASLASL